MTTFIQHIGRIHVGAGVSSHLDEELAMQNCHRPLVISDRGLERVGLVERIFRSSGKADPSRAFYDISENPTLECVLAALRVYQSANADSIVALGGGSVIDAAKAVALLATHPGDLQEYEVGRASRQIGPLGVPIIAMPTTAGTGSEVGRGMGIAFEDGRKGVFLSPHLVPRVALCDPELSFSLPARLTAGTGIDALSHCLEPLLSRISNPPAAAIALDGLKRMWWALPVAVARPHDAEARWQMSMGSVEGGLAMWKGLGPAHALALGLETQVAELHHGTCVGVLLPHCIADLERKCHPGLGVTKRALGIPDECSMAAALLNFNARIGLPSSLAALTSGPVNVAEVARQALSSSFTGNGLSPMTSIDYESILEAALED